MRSLAVRAWSALENWLNDSPKDAISWVKLAFQGLFVSLLWGVAISFMIISALPEDASVVSLQSLPEEFSFLLIGALAEEMLFRMMPLTLAMIFCRGKKLSQLLAVCFVCSFLLFGWAHIPNFSGFISPGWAAIVALSLQGMLGLYWGLLFIKVAKATDLLPLTAVLMTTLIHATYNLLILEILAFF